jgi:serine O-acetyltransferase
MFKSIWHLKIFLKKSKKNNLFRLLLIRTYESKLRKGNSWIGYNADIQHVPCFPHGISGIFISEGAKIGKNVVILQQVTIGSNTLNGSNTFGSPEIGDNMYIGAGAKIIGKK